MSRDTLDYLEQRDEFIRRHIGPGDEQIADINAGLELLRPLVG